MRRTIPTVTIAVLVAACSTTPATVWDLCDEYQTEACPVAVACGVEWDDVDACWANEVRLCAQRNGGASLAVDVDAAELAACLDDVGASSCTDVESWPPPSCRGLLD